MAEASKATVTGGKVNTGAKIVKCTCENSFMDEQYKKFGPKHRLANGCRTGWRCVVCLKIHS